MGDLVNGPWRTAAERASVRALDAEINRLTRVVQALREAHACGNRTLVASAHACIDSSEMPVTVRFESGSGSLGNSVIWNESSAAGSLAGNLRVDSLIFDWGRLDLKLGEVRITAEIASDGTVRSASVYPPDAGTQVTLQRRN